MREEKRPFPFLGELRPNQILTSLIGLPFSSGRLQLP